MCRGVCRAADAVLGGPRALVACCMLIRSKGGPAAQGYRPNKKKCVCGHYCESGSLSSAVIRGCRKAPAEPGTQRRHVVVKGPCSPPPGSRWPGITRAFYKSLPSSRKCGGPKGPSGGYKGPKLALSKIYKLGSTNLYLTYGGRLFSTLTCGPYGFLSARLG